MSRRWLGIALLLSVGVNLGVVAVFVAERLWPADASGTAASVEQPIAGPAAGPAEDPTRDPAEDPSDRPGQGPSPGGPMAPGTERPGTGPPPGIDPDPDPGFDPEEGPPPAIVRRLHLLADRLGLDGARRERFLEIQHTFFDQTHARRMRIITLQDRFRRELAGADPSAEAVQRLVEELGAERTALEAAFARAVLDTREILEPGQERLYLQFLARLRSGGPPGGIGPGGPGGRTGPGGPARPMPPRRRP